MLGIVDRFEGEFAVIELENKKIINIEKNKIPIETMVGDVLNIDNYITINLAETEKRKKHIEKLSENLWK